MSILRAKDSLLIVTDLNNLRANARRIFLNRKTLI